jgi:hypothetical protein
MQIRIDDQGFVYYGDIKLPLKYDPTIEALIFHDKDRRRSTERNTDQIVVPLAMFAVDLITIQIPEKSEVHSGV